MFGTFRDKLKETGPSTYRGGSEEKVDTKTAAAHDAKASLTTPPEAGFVFYMAINCTIWAILWLAVRQQYGLHLLNPHYLALLVSAGPVVLAQVFTLTRITFTISVLKVMANLTENTKRSMFYPFHKDGWKVQRDIMTLWMESMMFCRWSVDTCWFPAWSASARSTPWFTCSSVNLVKASTFGSGDETDQLCILWYGVNAFRNTDFSGYTQYA